jgi:hypothetical protein
MTLNNFFIEPAANKYLAAGVQFILSKAEGHMFSYEYLFSFSHK